MPLHSSCRVCCLYCAPALHCSGSIVAVLEPCHCPAALVDGRGMQHGLVPPCCLNRGSHLHCSHSHRLDSVCMIPDWCLVCRSWVQQEDECSFQTIDQHDGVSLSPQLQFPMPYGSPAPVSAPPPPQPSSRHPHCISLCLFWCECLYLPL